MLLADQPRPLPRLPYRRRWRLFAPAGALLTVLLPITAHVTGFDRAPLAGSAHRAYHISPDGDDANDGLSPARAWRSLAKAETVGFRPGDRLLLRGGARFQGSVRFGPGEAGAAATPVVVDSYGTGRATIEANGESGITVYDTAGVDIRNLKIVGGARSLSGMSGVKLYSDLTGGRRLAHVTISGVDVSGFQVGVEIGTAGGDIGFRDVEISNSVLHGNRDAGLATYGPPFDPAMPAYGHENVRVRNVEAHSNPGDPDDGQRSTGNGIVLGGVRGGLVEHSVAHHNGSKCAARFGPAGIWAYDSTSMVISHNVSFDNSTAGRADGGGFDLDHNVSSSILQYNLSYNNDGPGYLLYAPAGMRTHDNIVRFNISHNDARNSAYYAGINLAGVLSDIQVYHNTVVIEASGRLRPAALKLTGELSGVTVRNNIAVAHNTELVLATSAFARSEVLFQGNNLFRAGEPWGVQWGSTSYRDLARWRSATGQERAGSRDTGSSVDPRFVDPRFVGAGADPNQASPAPASPTSPAQGSPAQGTAVHAARAGQFRLSQQSPLVRGALDLRAMFGVDRGPADYFGEPVTGAVGAAQRAGGR